MSSLTEKEKRYLEKLFGMESGYVLDFTDATFGSLFKGIGIDIHAKKYQTYGTSKAKKLRAFWDQEPDKKVAEALSELVDSYETECELSDKKPSESLLTKAKETIARLESGKLSGDEERFLKQDVEFPELKQLPIPEDLEKVIDNRIDEASKARKAGASLSTIIMCGSALEGVLLAIAKNNPKEFHTAKCSPKDRTGKVKPWREWKLADLINVATELKLLGLDVKRFSEGMRDFRNYVHPNKQLEDGFDPSPQTAELCLQVLKVALDALAQKGLSRQK